MRTADFDYFLPEELIAQTPVEPRDHSRLMVVHRSNGTREHKHFYDILDYLNPNDCLVLNDTFKNLMSNNRFKGEIDNVIDFGLYTYNNIYKNNYQNYAFSLYQKYTYFDVCRILDWSKDETATIYGYKYDLKTNTFPVFINYHKDEEISDSIKYEDVFISRNILVAISKNKRNLSSADILNIKNAKNNNTKILLFVRKNKDDKENSKEFYFLGEIASTGNFEEFLMPSNDTAVKIEYLLETPVKEELYDYIVNK